MRLSTLCILWLFLASCNNTPLPAPSAPKLVSNCISATGGIEQWNKLSALKYSKVYTLFLTDGTIEKKLIEYHDFNKKNNTYEIKQIAGHDTIVTLFKNGNVNRWKNQLLLESSPSFLRSINASRYIISLPFVLANEPEIVSSLGKTKLPDSLSYDLIQATYLKGTSGQTTAEPWQFFIDRNTGLIKANKIHSVDHSSLVINENFTNVGPFHFYNERTSYRIDSIGQIQYLRAKYKYADYELIW